MVKEMSPLQEMRFLESLDKDVLIGMVLTRNIAIEQLRVNIERLKNEKLGMENRKQR